MIKNIHSSIKILRYSITVLLLLSSLSIFAQPIVDITVDGGSPHPTTGYQICAGESITLTASGGESYEWRERAGTVSVTIANSTVVTDGTNASITVSPTATTTYRVWVTDGTGTSISSDIRITVGSPPLFASLGDIVVCEGQAVNISWNKSSTGTVKYDVYFSGVYLRTINTSAAVINSSIATAATSDPSLSGTYTVIGMYEATGCSDTIEINLQINPKPKLTAPTTIITCDELDLTKLSEVEVIPSDAELTYWSNAAATTPHPNPNSIIANNANNFIKATDITTGCSVMSSRISATINKSPVVVATVNSPLCEGSQVIFGGAPEAGSIAVPATGWRWQAPDGSLVIADRNAMLPNATPDMNGIYHLIGTAANGCSDTAMVDVFVNPFAEFSIKDTIICEGADLDITDLVNVLGEDEIIYCEDEGATIELASTVIPTTTVGDTYYYVKGITNKGCENIKVIKVTVVANPLITISNPDPVCEETVDITNAGLGEGLTFGYWRDVVATDTLSTPQTTTLKPGDVRYSTYYIKGTDQHGCSVIEPVVIEINPLPTLELTDKTITACTPETVDITDEDLIVAASDYVSYTYWRNAASGELLTEEAEEISVGGTYYIKAETTEGCSVVHPIEVAINQTPTITVTSVSAICAPGTVDITSIANSNIAVTYTYWRDPEADADELTPAQAAAINEIGTNTYYIKGTTSDGCFDIKPVEVIIYPQPNLIIATPVIETCAPAIVDLTDMSITTGSDAGSFTYWLDASGYANPIPEPDDITVSGTFYIELVENGHSCVTREKIEVIITELPDGLELYEERRICSGGTIPIWNPPAGVGTVTWREVDNAGTIIGTGTGSIPPITATNTSNFPIIHRFEISYSNYSVTAFTGCPVIYEAVIEPQNEATLELVDGIEGKVCPDNPFTLTANVDYSDFVYTKWYKNGALAGNPYETNLIGDRISVVYEQSTEDTYRFIAETRAGCKIDLTINVQLQTNAFLCKSAVYLGNDTTLCDGENLILKPDKSDREYFEFEWFKLGESQPIGNGDSYTVTEPGTYVIRTKEIDKTSLVFNGDFEMQDNSGFSSQYCYTPITTGNQLSNANRNICSRPDGLICTNPNHVIGGTTAATRHTAACWNWHTSACWNGTNNTGGAICPPGSGLGTGNGWLNPEARYAITKSPNWVHSNFGHCLDHTYSRNPNGNDSNLPYVANTHTQDNFPGGSAACRNTRNQNTSSANSKHPQNSTSGSTYNNSQVPANWTNTNRQGAGHMMVVNGANAQGAAGGFLRVWCQDITVAPNTDYIFSAWFTSVHPDAPAVLQFFVNGALLQDDFTIGCIPCQWQQYYAEWKTPSNVTSTEICIVNKNTTAGGNDFAIDDIYYARVYQLMDTIQVNYIDLSEIDITVDSKEICSGGSAKLTASEGADSYEWRIKGQTAIISTDRVITVSPTINTEYEVTAYSGARCSLPKSISVTVNPAPVINTEASLGNSTTEVCEGDVITLRANVSGSNLVHTWTSPNGTTVGNNSATYTKTGTVMSDAGKYTYTVRNTTNNCTATLEVDVTVNAKPTLLVTDPAPICVPGEVDLTDAAITAGSSLGLSFTYHTNNNVAQANNGTNILANTVISSNGTYYIRATSDNGCTSDIKQVIVKVNNPPVFASLGNVEVCEGQAVNISWNKSSTGIVKYDIYFSGIFQQTISTSSSLINFSIATAAMSNPDMSGTYTVVGMYESTGCADTIEIDVLINPLPQLSITNPPAVCYPNVVDITSSEVLGIDINVTPDLELTYWQNSTGSGVSEELINPNAIDDTNNANRTYYVRAEYTETGCSVVRPVVTRVNPKPNVSAETNNPICEGERLTLTGGVSSGSVAITSSTSYWEGLDNGFTNTGTSYTLSNTPITMNGHYRFIGITNQGCMDTAYIEVEVKEKPQLEVKDTIACHPATIDILYLVNGADSYKFYTTAGGNTEFASTELSGVRNTNFWVIGTTNGCSSPRAQGNVTIENTPTVTLKHLETCDPNEINLEDAVNNLASFDYVAYYDDASATGASEIYTYQNISGAQTNTPYWVVVTKGHCESEPTQGTFTIKPQPVVELELIEPVCNYPNTNIDLSEGVSGADSYKYYYVSDNSEITARPPLVSGVQVSTGYYVIGTTDGCPSEPAYGEFTINALPKILVTQGNICHDESIILTANGADIYEWSPAMGLSAITGSQVTATPPVGTHTYTITGTDINTCVNDTTITVRVIERPDCSIMYINEYGEEETVSNSSPRIPNTYCPNDVVQFFAPAEPSVLAAADGQSFVYEWIVTGNASIVGVNNQQTVLVKVGADCGTPYTVTLRVRNSALHDVPGEDINHIVSEELLGTSLPAGKEYCWESCSVNITPTTIPLELPDEPEIHLVRCETLAIPPVPPLCANGCPQPAPTIQAGTQDILSYCSSGCSEAKHTVRKADPFINYFETDTYNGCEGTISYTWIYTEYCTGEEQTWTYTYNVEREDFNVPSLGSSTVSCVSQATQPTAPADIVRTYERVPQILSIKGDCENHTLNINNIFDRNPNTKWVADNTVMKLPNSRIYWTYDMPVMPGGYTMTSADDLQDYDPKSWKYYGSNNGTDWILLDAQTNVEFNGRNETLTFDEVLHKDELFNYYQFEITETWAGDVAILQLSDVEFNTQPITCTQTITPVFIEREETTYDGCEGDVTYRWRYTDCRNVSKDWVYTYNVEQEDFSIPEDPAPVKVSCVSMATIPAAPANVTHCENTISPVFLSDDSGNYDGCEGTVVYIWRYTDCTGKFVHDYTYTYNVTPINPIITVTSNGNKDYGCVLSAPNDEPTFNITDVCNSGATLNVSNTITNNGFSYAKTFVATYINACGTWTETVTYNWLIKPEISAANNSPICEGDELLFTSTIERGDVAVYDWTGPNSFTSSQANPTIPFANRNANGTYRLIVTSEHGCQDTAYTDVMMNLKPVLETKAMAVCYPNTVDLSQAILPSSALEGSNFTYYKDKYLITASSTTVSTTGTYYVLALTPEGCRDTSEISVTIHALPTFTLTKEDSKCYANTGSIQITNASTANYSYTINGVANGSLTGLGEGNYTIVVTDNNTTCESLPQTISIYIDNSPTLSITTHPTRTLDCNNPFVELHPQGNNGTAPYTYSIDGGATYSSTDVYTVNVKGVYG
ncbi:MAG: hypothetical protein LBR45_02260, partial [Bacteroidales bacterium]|nr:hypothetical protein [Bacteroidales bacterium]